MARIADFYSEEEEQYIWAHRFEVGRVIAEGLNAKFGTNRRVDAVRRKRERMIDNDKVASVRRATNPTCCGGSSCQIVTHTTENRGFAGFGAIAQQGAPAPRRDAPAVQTARESYDATKAALVARAASCGVSGLVGPPARKILVLADTHAPYQRDDLIADALRAHADSDILVLGGDHLDADAASSFQQHRRMPLIDEYRHVFRLVEQVSSRFREVYLLDGNHERRLSRMFAKFMPLEVTSIFQVSPLERIAAGHELDDAGRLVRVHDWPHVHHCPAEVQIGDMVCVHPDKYLGQTATIPGMRTAYLSSRGALRKGMDWRCLVMPHTHHVGSIVADGRLLIETGCLCHRIPWEMRDTSLTKGPQDLGFAVVVQDAEGRTDFNRSHYVYLGSKYPSREAPDGVRVL